MRSYPQGGLSKGVDNLFFINNCGKWFQCLSFRQKDHAPCRSPLKIMNLGSIKVSTHTMRYEGCSHFKGNPSFTVYCNRFIHYKVSFSDSILDCACSGDNDTGVVVVAGMVIMRLESFSKKRADHQYNCNHPDRYGQTT